MYSKYERCHFLQIECFKYIRKYLQASIYLNILCNIQNTVLYSIYLEKIESLKQALKNTERDNESAVLSKHTKFSLNFYVKNSKLNNIPNNFKRF